MRCRLLYDGEPELELDASAESVLGSVASEAGSAPLFDLRSDVLEAN